MIRVVNSNLSALSGLSATSGGQLSLGEVGTTIEGYTTNSWNIVANTGAVYTVNGTTYTGTNSTQVYPSGFYSIKVLPQSPSVSKFNLTASSSNAATGYLNKIYIDGNCFTSDASIYIYTGNAGHASNTNPAYQVTDSIVVRDLAFTSTSSSLTFNGVSVSSGSILLVNSAIQGDFNLSNTQVSTLVNINSTFNPNTIIITAPLAANPVPANTAATTIDLRYATLDIDIAASNPVNLTYLYIGNLRYVWSDLSDYTNLTYFNLYVGSPATPAVPIRLDYLPSSLLTLRLTNLTTYAEPDSLSYKLLPNVSTLGISYNAGLFSALDLSFFPGVTYLELISSKIVEVDYGKLPDLQQLYLGSCVGRLDLRQNSALYLINYGTTAPFYYTPQLSPTSVARNIQSISSWNIIPEQGEKLYNQIAYIRARGNYANVPSISGSYRPIGGKYSADSLSYFQTLSTSFPSIYTTPANVWGHWTEDSMQSNGQWNNTINSGNSRNFVALNGGSPVITYKQGLNRRYKGLDFSGAGNRFLSCQTPLPFNSANWTLVLIGWMPEDVATRQIMMSTYHGAQTGVRVGEINNLALCNNYYTDASTTVGTGFSAAASNTRVYPLVPFGICVIRTSTGSVTTKVSIAGKLLTSFSSPTITTIGSGTETRLGGFSPGTYLFQGSFNEVIFLTEANDIYSTYVVPKVRSLIPAGVSVTEDPGYGFSANAYAINTVSSYTDNPPAVSGLHIISPAFGASCGVSGASRLLSTVNNTLAITCSSPSTAVDISSTNYATWVAGTQSVNNLPGIRHTSYTLLFVGRTTQAYPTAQTLVNNNGSTSGYYVQLHGGNVSLYGKTLSNSVKYYGVGVSANTDTGIRGQKILDANSTFFVLVSYDKFINKIRILTYQDGSWASCLSSAISEIVPSTSSLRIGTNSNSSMSFFGDFQNFVMFNRYLDISTLRKVVHNNIQIFNSTDPYLTVTSLQEAATKPTGLYKFRTISGSTFPVYIKDGEILIGRGRNNWNWTNSGSGTPDEVTFCVEDDVKYQAFTPAYLSQTNVNAILSASGLSLNRVNTKIYRAIDALNSQTQTITWRLRNATWDWNMWNNLPIDNWSVVTPGLANISGTNGGTSSGGTNDITRWLTYGIAETNNQVGFAGGYFAEGDNGINNWGDASITNYGYEYNNSSYTTPYSEVYLSLIDKSQGLTLEKDFMDLTKYNDCIGLYGFTALSTAYKTLPVCQLHNFNTGLKQDFTAVQLANGEHLTFAGNNSVGVYKLYDQTGGGNHLIATVDTASPFIVVSGVGVYIDGQVAMRCTDTDIRYFTFTSAVSPKSVYFTIKDVYTGDDAPILGTSTTSGKSSITVFNNNTGQINAATGTSDSVYVSVNESNLLGPAPNVALSPGGSNNWSTTAGLFSVHYETGPATPFTTYLSHGSAGIGSTALTAKTNLLALFSTDKRPSHQSIRNSIRFLLNPLNTATNLFGWWDNTSIETNSNGDFVRWNDKTLNGNYLKVKAGSPTVSVDANKRVISLNGLSSLETTINLISNEVSYYIVAKATNNSFATLVTNGGSVLYINTGYGQGNPNFFLSTVNGSFSMSTSTNSYLVPNSRFIGSARWSSTLGSINGVQGTIDSNNSNNAVSTGSLAAGSTLVLGENGSGAAFFTGTICEVIAFNSRISDAQHTAITNYLKGKWTAVTTLPSFMLYNDSASLIANFDENTLGNVDSDVYTWKSTMGSTAYDLTALESFAPTVKTWRDGRKAVYFDGTGEGFTSNGLPDNKTIVMVGEIETNQTRAFLMHSTRTGIQLDFGSKPTTVNAVTSGTGADTNVADANGVNSGLTTNSAFILIAYWDATQCLVGYDIQFNGILLSDTNIGTGDFLSDNVARNWFRYLYDNSLRFKGYIAEMSIYNRPLGLAERNTLRSRLIEKYGGF